MSQVFSSKEVSSRNPRYYNKMWDYSNYILFQSADLFQFTVDHRPALTKVPLTEKFQLRRNLTRGSKSLILQFTHLQNRILKILVTQNLFSKFSKIESAKKSLNQSLKPTAHPFLEHFLSTYTYRILQTGKGTVLKTLQ